MRAGRVVGAHCAAKPNPSDGEQHPRNGWPDPIGGVTRPSSSPPIRDSMLCASRPARARWRFRAGHRLVVVASGRSLLLGFGLGGDGADASRTSGSPSPRSRPALACFAAARRTRRGPALLDPPRPLRALAGAADSSLWTWYDSSSAARCRSRRSPTSATSAPSRFAVAALALRADGPQTLAGRLRTLIDGLIIAGSLLARRAGSRPRARVPGRRRHALAQVDHPRLPDRRRHRHHARRSTSCCAPGRRTAAPRPRSACSAPALLATARFADSGFAYMTATNSYASGQLHRHRLVRRLRARPARRRHPPARPRAEDERGRGRRAPLGAPPPVRGGRPRPGDDARSSSCARDDGTRSSSGRAPSSSWRWSRGRC